jgi:hypothetical protein
MSTNNNGKTWLKCRRSRSEVFKKEDIEKYFDFSSNGTIQENVDMKNINANYKKFEFFSIEPRFRFNDLGDNKLKDKDDLLYFAIYALDRESNPQFVTYVYCGYLTAKKSTFRWM